MSGHENYTHHDVKGASDKNFGFTFTVVAAVLGLWPLVHGKPIRVWALAVSAVFLAVTLVNVSLLSPLNKIWTRFGLLLSRIVSPIVSALVFFVAVTPIAVIMRWKGKDPLRLKPSKDANTYWIERVPPGPEPESMANQF